MPAAPKSPLHPSALTLNALTVGRTILRFNRHNGAQGSFIVMERPCVRMTKLGRHSMVKLKEVRFGTTRYHFLSDLGVLPAWGRFNEGNFVVDHRKAHLLPTELVPRSPEPQMLFDSMMENERSIRVEPFSWETDRTERYPW